VSFRTTRRAIEAARTFSGQGGGVNFFAIFANVKADCMDLLKALHGYPAVWPHPGLEVKDDVVDMARRKSSASHRLNEVLVPTLFSVLVTTLSSETLAAFRPIWLV